MPQTRLASAASAILAALLMAATWLPTLDAPAGFPAAAPVQAFRA